MKIFKPLWEDGVLLTPNHFQQQSLYLEQYSKFMNILKTRSGYGIRNFDINQELLATGIIQCIKAEGIFQNGVYFNTSNSEHEIKTKKIDPVLLNEKTITIYLGLSLQGTSNSGSLDYAYEKKFKTISDIYLAENEHEVLVEYPDIQIRLSTENNDSFLLIPVAKLDNEMNSFIVDKEFIPLAVNLHFPAIYEYLTNISAYLSNKINELNRKKKAKNKVMIDFSLSDISLITLIQILSRAYLQIKNFINNPELYGLEDLYSVITGVLSDISVYFVDYYLDELKLLNYELPSISFETLYKFLVEKTDSIMPSMITTIEFQKFKSTQWKASINNELFTNAKRIFLSFKADNYKPLELVDLVPKMCKVAAPSVLNNIVNSAIKGVEIEALFETPKSFPTRFDSAFFELKNTNGELDQILAEKECDIYIPGMIINPVVFMLLELNDE